MELEVRNPFHAHTEGKACELIGVVVALDGSRY